jgi:hypothetical protein
MSGFISGRVVDASGAPVPGAVITLSGTDGVLIDDVAGLTDAGGLFRRGGLAPGSYQVNVRKTGQPSRSVQFVVSEGEQVNVEVQLVAPVDPIENSGVLEVELQAHRIDWDRVRLVRVALDYPGSGRSDATGKDYVLTPGNRDVAPWRVRLNDVSRSNFAYKIEYFLRDGSRKRVSATDASARVLVLEPPQ